MPGSVETTLFNQFKVLLAFFSSVIYNNCQDFLLWLQSGQILEWAIFQHCRDIKKWPAENGPEGMNKTSMYTGLWWISKKFNGMMLWYIGASWKIITVHYPLRRL